MSPEIQQLIRQLRGEGLSDEEIVWYAVNMQDLEERDIRAELHRSAQQPESEHSAQEARARSSSSSNRASAAGTSAPRSGRVDRVNAGRGGARPGASAEGHRGRASSRYRDAMENVLAGAIVLGLVFGAGILFGSPARAERVFGDFAPLLDYLAPAALASWAILHQVEIALPGRRWLCALRPVLYVAFIVALQYSFAALIDPAYTPALHELPGMIMTGLLFFEGLVVLRRWLVPAWLALFAGAHFVWVNFAGWAVLSLQTAWSSPAPFFDAFVFFPPYILTEGVPLVEYAALALMSVLTVTLCWALFAFLGAHQPGRRLSGVVRAPGAA